MSSTAGTAAAAQDRRTILHITDVHSALDQLQKLQEWLENERENVDIMLLSGDIANMPMELGADPNSPKEELERYRRDLQDVVAASSRICSNLYYIPGNHDVPSAYSPPLESSDLPMNVHHRCVKISPGLFLAGLGGSVPGFKDNKQYWDGFPFTKEEEMAAEVEKLMGSTVVGRDSPLGDEDQLLLMTHNGPSHSSTTLLTQVDPSSPIESGCLALHQWLCRPEAQQRIIMNVHGHTHGGFGEAQIGEVSILNPGPLMEGRFGLYTISFSPKKERWELTSVRRYKL